MNISHNSIDALNSQLTVSIDKSDYMDKVEKTLKTYKKNASVKGFRKGHVPMSYVRKQFEKSIIADEVNQLLQTGINDFIRKENISMLGNPLPIEQADFDWNADPLNFEFEIGLAPDFKVDLSKIKVDTYKIKVGEDEISKYVKNFSERYGAVKSIDKVADEGAVNIKVQIKELDKDKNEVQDGFENETYFFTDELAKASKFHNKKVGDKVVLKLNEISKEASVLENLLGMKADEQKDFDGLIQASIVEISVQEPAAIDQALFDKIYGEGTVKNEKEFRQKIQQEAEKMYARETDNYLVNEVVEALIKETKFELPNEFLSRWLHYSNDNIQSVEEAAERLKKEEEGLRYQLIESKIAEDFDVKVEYEEVLNAIRENIKNQMAMYGQFNLTDDDIENIVQSSAQNENEFRKISEQVFGDKMKKVFKDNVKAKEIEISFDDFMDMVEKKHSAKHHDHDHDHNHDHDHDHDHEHNH